MSVETIVGVNPGARPRPASEKEALRDGVEDLIIAVRTLISVFEKAKEDMKAEPTQQVLMKLDELTIYNKQLIQQNSEILEQTSRALQQNKDVAHSLAMLLDLHREHLPEIAKHTRVTSEVRRVDELGSPRATPLRHSRHRSFDEETPADLGHP